MEGPARSSSREPVPLRPSLPIGRRAHTRRFALAAVLLAAVLAGCGGDAPSAGSRGELREPRMVAELGRDAEPVRGSASERAAAAAVERSAGSTDAPGPAAAPASGEPPRVVFLGDSLTAGFGLGEGDAWPARVTAALAAEGLPIRAVNAGISGDTSAGGLARVDWILRLQPDVVVVELGPNDGLRGLPLEATEDNLRQITRRIEAAGAEVLLVGLRIPPNYGPDYSGRFHDLYPRLAAELGVPLVPFLLEGVGGEPDLNLPDGIHPNVAGHRLVAGNVLPHLRPLVAEAAGG